MEQHESSDHTVTTPVIWVVLGVKTRNSQLVLLLCYNCLATETKPDQLTASELRSMGHWDTPWHCSGHQGPGLTTLSSQTPDYLHQHQSKCQALHIIQLKTIETCLFLSTSIFQGDPILLSQTAPNVSFIQRSTIWT